MEELQIKLTSSLNDLKNTVDEFVAFNRGDKKVLHDIYISEFTSLITYFEKYPIPASFKRNELRILLNKINDEIKKLRKLLSCYSDLRAKKHQLETDFDIVEKSTVLYHHLEDLTHTMGMYLGFDRTDKYSSLESLFDQVIIDMNDRKKKKYQAFQNELLVLKNKIQETQLYNKADLIKEVTGLLDELNSSGIFNQKKAFLIKQEFDEMNRQNRKETLKKNILSRVSLRLLGVSSVNIASNSLESFDMELEKIKKSYLHQPKRITLNTD